MLLVICMLFMVCFNIKDIEECLYMLEKVYNICSICINYIWLKKFKNIF